VIYTPHKRTSRREAEKGPISRSAGENADRDDLSTCFKTGRKWAPIGHKMSRFGPSATASDGAKG